MIVNLRGTSGSGKSTIVRAVMDRFPRREKVVQEGRKQPIGYVCSPPEDEQPRQLFVLGHYETACGGCDTITDGMDRIYYLVNEYAGQGFDVIYEGLLVQSDVRRCGETAKRFPTMVVIVDEPIEVCIAGVQARRDARGDTRPLDPRNTVSKAGTIPGQERRLRELGVDVSRLRRDAALRAVLGALGL